jgi:hypothetical protein
LSKAENPQRPFVEGLANYMAVARLRNRVTTAFWS